MIKYDYPEARKACQRYLDHLAREKSAVLTYSHYTLMECYRAFDPETIDAILDQHWQDYKAGKTSEYKLYEG